MTVDKAKGSMRSYVIEIKNKSSCFSRFLYECLKKMISNWSVFYIKVIFKHQPSVKLHRLNDYLKLSAELVYAQSCQFLLLLLSHDKFKPIRNRNSVVNYNV